MNPAISSSDQLVVSSRSRRPGRVQYWREIVQQCTASRTCRRTGNKMVAHALSTQCSSNRRAALNTTKTNELEETAHNKHIIDGQRLDNVLRMSQFSGWVFHLGLLNFLQSNSISLTLK
ncbi:hypothetical protein Q7C36_006822 [Tachysurus vachellii]|uniref:Uncharacterized protein n=1 Tax=Tachysurus vachellii TaxID=175792 RepID=A0AA88NAY6_TACVA|nr:hypothetical protein Q7C36_006822 [Tachysurus vachellii]